MKLSFFGAAGEVGRNCILVQEKHFSFLLDCGISLGKELARDRFPQISLKQASELKAIIVSHAHLDHSGFVPFLVKKGFKGKIYCTKTTRDLMHLLLSDAAKIGKEERNAIYSTEDVENTMKLVQAIEYEKEIELEKGLKFKFLNAGHIPGSAMVLLEFEKKKLLYTADFNSRESNLLPPASFPKKADIIIMESTYGSKKDQLPSIKHAGKELADVIKGTLQQGGQVLIPVFAVGRGQEIMLSLENYIRSKYLPEISIFLDGMVARANRICRHNVIYLKPEIPNRILLADDDPFKSPYLKVPKTRGKEDVLATNDAVILATSGMMTAGPVLTYLKKMTHKPENCIVIAGFQAIGTKGRELLEGAKEIEVNGKRIRIKCRIERVSFSAHADYNGLVNSVRNLSARKIFIIHGEEKKMKELEEGLKKHCKARVLIPKIKEHFII